MDKNYIQSIFLPYQQRWLLDNSRLKIMRKSRRIGITWAQAFADVIDAAKSKKHGGMDVFFSSADQSSAREYADTCKMWAEVLKLAAGDVGETVIADSGMQAYRLEFESGFKILAMTSSPSQFRSKGGKAVMDEFNFNPDAKALWQAAAPATTWGYPAVIISTVQGRDTEFYRKSENAKTDPDWSFHEVTIVDAVNDGLVQKINRLDRPATDEENAEFLRYCRKLAGDEETFLEEYMCQPQDGRSSYIPWQLIEDAESEALPEVVHIHGSDWNEVHQDTLPSAIAQHLQGNALAGGNAPRYLGLDIGRKNDLTVFTVLEKRGERFYVVLMVRIQQAMFRVQRAFGEYLMRQLGITQACGDATGLGMQLNEEMQNQFPTRWQPVTFSGASMTVMATRVKSLLEDRAIKIPAGDEQLRSSIRKIKRTVTTQGRVSFSAPSDVDGHADEFWSIALAAHASSNSVVFVPYESISPAAITAVEATGFEVHPRDANDFSGRRRAYVGR